MREAQTAHYQDALVALARHARGVRFDRPATFYAWERLNTLVAELERLYDAFELEGDLEPVRRAFARYEADVDALGVPADPWVAQHLQTWLERLSAPTLDVVVGAGPTPTRHPAHYLSIRPDALDALMEARRESAVPPTTR